MRRNIDWLQDRLQIKESKQLGKLLVKTSVLTMSVENNLAPTMDAMQDHLGLNRNEMALVFRREISLLAYNFFRSTRPKIDWLQERLSLDRDQLRKVVKKHPTLLVYKTEDTLEPRLVWLRKRLGISEEALRHFVVRAPTILSLSIRNLETKFGFLQAQLGESLTVDSIVHTPLLLACSLEARLKPRIAEARDNGIVLDANCLSRISTYPEKKWAASVGYQVRKREREDEIAANW